MRKSQRQRIESTEEFQKMKDFTRRLMAVPKKEIDKQKAEYERKKPAKKIKVA